MTITDQDREIAELKVRIADQLARHEVELRALQAQIAELEQGRDKAQAEINRQKVRIDKRDGIIRAKNADLSDLAQERDRLRGALKAPGLYQPTVETDRKPTL